MLTDVANNLKTMSGQTDDARVLSLLDSAAHEIWDSVDLPGVLREVRVTTDREKFVTLPADVYRLRAVRHVHSTNPVELATAIDRYRDFQFVQNVYTWRLLYRTPLCRRITNATRIRFTARKPVSARTTITIAGPTDLGTYVEDTLRIEAGQSTVTSNENYTDVALLVKDVNTSSDIDVTDANSNVISVLPNAQSGPMYWLAQIRERCDQGSCSFCQCFDVLYKPVLPPITSLKSYFPEGFEQVLLFKALEHVYLGKEDMLDTANAYNQKALALLQQFQTDEAAGKSLRPNIKRNPLQTRTGYVRI